MTLVVARKVAGQLQFVADTFISVRDLNRSNRRLFGDAVKLQLLTRHCCIAFAGNADLADKILLDYRHQVLPNITVTHRYTGSVTPSLNFADATLAFFSRRYLESADARNPADFIVAFAQPDPVMFRMTDGCVNEVGAHNAFIGDHAAYELYQRALYAKKPADDQFALRMVFGGVRRQGEAHPPVGSHPSLDQMVGALQTVCEHDGQESVGGFVTGAYSWDGGFYYYDHGSLMRSAVDEGSAIAYSVVPVLNDPSRIVLYLGSRETTDTPLAVIYAPVARDDPEPRLKTCGGYSVPYAMASMRGTVDEFSSALYDRLRVEVDLPQLSVRGRTNAILMPLFSRVSRLAHTSKALLADANQMLSKEATLTRETWKAVKTAASVSFRFARAHFLGRPVFADVVNLFIRSAYRSTERKAKHIWRICSSLLAELVEQEQRNLNYRMIQALVLLEQSRYAVDELAQNEQALQALDAFAHCCAKGSLSQQVAEKWTQVMAKASVGVYGRDRMQQHSALLARTLGQPPKTVRIDPIIRAWLRARLIFLRFDRLGERIQRTAAAKLTRALSRVYLGANPNAEVCVLLARSLHLEASYAGRVQRAALTACSVPYLRAAVRLDATNINANFHLARALLFLAATAKSEISEQLVIEADAVIATARATWPSHAYLGELDSLRTSLQKHWNSVGS